MHVSLASGEKITQRIRDMLAPIVTASKADLAPDSQRFIAHCKWLLSQNCGLGRVRHEQRGELPVDRRTRDACSSLFQSLRSSFIHLLSLIIAELVFWAIVGGLRTQKYEGGKSASGARQSRCDVGAV